MNNPQTALWEPGKSVAPLPPLVEEQDKGTSPSVLYQKYGPVFRILQSGKEPQIILAGPEMNAFMAHHEDEFFTTQQFWQAFDAMISQQQENSMTMARDGQANRQRRAQSSRQWSRARILDQIELMTTLTHEHTQGWAAESIAVHASMRRLVAEQLAHLLLGTQAGDYLDDFIIYLNTTIANTLMSDGSEPACSSDDPAYQQAAVRVMEFSRQVYEAHLTHPQPNGKPDMMDEAIEGAERVPEAYRRMMLSHLALGPMLAGLDTVANSLSFMLYALLANPDAAQRVQGEVDAALGDGPLTWEKLKQMPDLHGAMMETLRRYPVGAGHRCQVSAPLTLAGYRLEPGNEVYVAMTVPHFLEEIYPDPYRFDIDRFRAPRSEHRTPGAYAPFGLGNHTCLGAGIAEVQLAVTMAVLLYTYTFQFDPPDYQFVIEEHPTPAPGNHFRVKVAKRSVASASEKEEEHEQ